MLAKTWMPAAFLLSICWAAAGCGDDDDGKQPAPDAGGNVTPTPDAGGNVTPTPEGGVTSDGGGSGGACNSFTLPSGNMCGGSHCRETLAELVSKADTSKACKTEAEATEFCSLNAPNKVRECAVANFGRPAADRDRCAATALPSVSAGCLNCYLISAECASMNCAAQCLTATAANPGTCDQCRVEKGCIAMFYSCAGYNGGVLPTQ